jgi:urea-proton symporter
MDVTKIFPLFGQETGLMMIAVYAIFVFALTSWFAKGYDKDKESFLVANRELGLVQGSISAGASWIWAPGLFVAAQQGFNNGIAGVFWFSLGNFFSLILYAAAVHRFRDKVGDGFTLSQWFREKYGRVSQYMILLMMTLFCIQGMTINLFASSNSVKLLTGLPPLTTCVLLVALALTYSWRGGQKATVATDMVKIAAIWIGMAIVAVSVFGTIGFQPALDGLGGVKGQGDTLFGNPFAMGLFFGFGIPTVLGHLAGAWTDNSYYQNAFSMQKSVVRKAFTIAPFYWLILPIVGGLLGLSAAGLHYDVKGPQTGFINLIVMANVVGAWLPLVFMAVVFSGLVSIIDTQLISVANMVGNDIHDSRGGNDPILWGRISMLLLGALGIVLANIPGLDLGQIFLFGKTLTLIFFLPIVMAIVFDDLLTREGFVAGGAVGLFIGAPIFIYGQFFGGGNDYILAGVLTQVFGGAAAAYLVSKLTDGKETPGLEHLS